ncbi:MAG TPA: hypothetical protein VI603_18950 [Saprospiraceae bacterium]|nr:hypothetical protein [Saprospiraceae bacterium]
MKFTATLFSFIIFNLIAHPGFSQVSFSTDYGMYENQIAVIGSNIFLQRDVMIHSMVDFNFDADLFNPYDPLPTFLEADFDDGFGFRNVVSGATFSISYSSPGEKVITFKTSEPGGLDITISVRTLVIKDSPYPYISPDEIWDFGISGFEPPIAGHPGHRHPFGAGRDSDRLRTPSFSSTDSAGLRTPSF